MMLAQTLKQEVIESLQRLPDDANIDEMMYRLYVVEKIRRGRQSAEEGKSLTSEELLKDIQTW